MARGRPYRPTPHGPGRRDRRPVVPRRARAGRGARRVGVGHRRRARRAARRPASPRGHGGVHGPLARRRAPRPAAPAARRQAACDPLRAGRRPAARPPRRRGAAASADGGGDGAGDGATRSQAATRTSPGRPAGPRAVTMPPSGPAPGVVGHGRPGRAPQAPRGRRPTADHVGGPGGGQGLGDPHAPGPGPPPAMSALSRPMRRLAPPHRTAPAKAPRRPRGHGQPTPP